MARPRTQLDHPRRTSRLIVASILLAAGLGSNASAQRRKVRRPDILVVVGETTTTTTTAPVGGVGPTSTTTSTLPSFSLPPTTASTVAFDPKDPRCRVKFATRALLDRQMAKASTQLARADSRLRRAQFSGPAELLAALSVEFNDAVARVNAVQADLDALVQRCH